MYTPHDHEWKFNRKTCCYILKCIIPGCERQTKAYYLKGREPRLGELVRFMDDGETIEVDF